jgi:hypothetical protein
MKSRWDPYLDSLPKAVAAALSFATKPVDESEYPAEETTNVTAIEPAA